MSDSVTLPLNGQQIFARIVSVTRSGSLGSTEFVQATDRAPGIQVVAAQTAAQLERALRGRSIGGARTSNFYTCT